MTEKSVQILVKKFFRKECTAEERKELARWIDQSARDTTLKTLLQDAWKEFEPVERMTENKAAGILSFILNSEEEAAPIIAPVRHMWFTKVAIALVITVLTGAVGYYMFFDKSTPQIVTSAKKNSAIPNEAYPGSQKATLTLSDGSTVVLDKVTNETITHQGNTQVINSKGELVYNSTNDNSLPTLYNSLNTTRGELYPLKLSDGTRIWLNSASSIHFPVAFNGNERVVDITGEAYFEVAKNPAKPFKVRLNGMEIEVLGTHFNINGYADEPIVKTTLLEGSLRVTKGNSGVMLTPGQQARLIPGGNIEVIKNANTEEVVSWTSGYFHFNNSSLQTVMRQLSRWYDMDVEYEDKLADQYFTGDIDKNYNLSQVVKLLERSQVRCRITGKKIIVLRS